MKELKFDLRKDSTRPIIQLYETSAMIDTGSAINVCTWSRTIIEKQFKVLKTLPKIIDSASDSVSGLIYIVESFSIGELVLHGVPIFSPDKPSLLKTKIVLGYTLFNGLIMEIDTIQGVFTIKIPDDITERKYQI